MLSIGSQWLIFTVMKAGLRVWAGMSSREPPHEPAWAPAWARVSPRMSPHEPAWVRMSPHEPESVLKSENSRTRARVANPWQILAHEPRAQTENRKFLIPGRSRLAESISALPKPNPAPEGNLVIWKYWTTPILQVEWVQSLKDSSGP